MAIQFDSGEYLSRTANLPATTGATLCAWGYPSSTITSATWRQFIAFGNTGTPIEIGLGNDNEAGNNWGIVNSQTTAHSSLGTAPGANVPFFAAIVLSGTGANQFTGYYRLASTDSLATTSIASSSFTINSVRVGTSVHDGTDYWVGAAWNVKCWDRALSQAELMEESLLDYVKYKDSLNFFWHLANVGDTYDYGPQKRNATVNGSISTTPNLKQSRLFRKNRRLIFLPGSTQSFSYTATGGITLAGTSAQLRLISKLASGGLTLAGTSAELRKIVTVASGGIVLAGSSLFAKGMQRTASGGLSLAGTASENRTRVAVPSGGLNIAGSSGYSSSSGTQTFSYTAVGGMVLAGVSTVLRKVVYVASGGLQFGGSGTVSYFPPFGGGIRALYRKMYSWLARRR